MATPASRPVPAVPGALPRVAVGLYFLHLGASLAIPLVLAWLLYRFVPWDQETAPPRFIHWLMVLYPVLGRLWWVRMAVGIVAYIAFIAWLYVRYRELAKRGAPTRYKPHWAITGTLVPLLNFVRPYQVTADAFRAAAAQRMKTGFLSSTPAVVKWWWGLFMGTAVIGALGGKAVMPGHMELGPILVAWYLGAAASSALAIAVIASFERERSSTGLFGSLPAPVTAGGGAALATALVLLGVFGFAAMGMQQLKEGAGMGFFLPPEAIPRGAVPPRPPSSWQVEARLGGDAVHLSWFGSNAQGYYVYRREGDSAPAKITPEPIASTRFDDFRIEPGRNYFYSVSELDRFGDESPRSDEATLTVPGEAWADSSLAPSRVVKDIVAPVGVPGGVEGGVEGGVAGGIVGGVVGDETAKSAAQLRTVRVPQPILMGNAISRTEPAYPAIARRARVSGLVVIQVTVGTDGSVKGARVVSGHPMLVQSALDAVRKWRFRPYLVNGNVVEVESNITLVFRLAP